MKRILFFLILVVASLNTFAKGYETFYSQPNNQQHQVSFEINEWSLSTVEFNGVNFQQINFNVSTVTEKKGWAELPFISASIQLPAQKNVDLDIVFTDYTDYQLDYPLVPSRGVINRSQDPSTIPYEIDPASIVDSFYPNDLAFAEEPFIIRDVRGTAIRVFPFQYNSVTNTLRVYNKIDVVLTENKEPATNPLIQKDFNPVKEAIGIYQSIFLNFDASKYDLPMAQHGEILVITTARDSETIDTYIQWKREKGFVVHKEVVSTNYSASNTKSLIQNKYNANNNILYVQIIGDWADIKSEVTSTSNYNTNNKPQDPKLGCVAGNDNYPDIAIGRFSCSNASQLNVQINKSINYEKTPNMEPNWRESFLALAGNESGGDDGESDLVHIGRIYSQKLQPFTYNTIYENYQPNATVAGVSNNLNSGTSTLAYCAHGLSDGFYFNYGFSFKNNNVNQLTNGDKLPFIVACACNTGEFSISGSDCFAETWLKKENGGAILTWMASISQPWQPPMRGQDYFYDILVGGFDYNLYPGQNGISTTEQRTTWGSIVVNAGNLMISEAGSGDILTVHTWHTFGDASLQLRTKQPDQITSSATTVTPGSPFSTTIKIGNTPVKDALVCISQNGSYKSALTDSNGQVSITHSFTTGEVLLVVTAFNTTTIYTTLPIGGSIICDPVTNLQVNLVNENVQLTWNAQPQAISYIVKRNGTQIANPTTTSYTDVNAPSGLQSYCVIAKYSSCDSEETCKSINVPSTGCDPVTNLQANLVNENVQLTWNAQPQAISYIVKRNGTQIANPTTASYTDVNAPSGLQSYCVIAKYSSCESEETCKSINVPIIICDPVNNLQANLVNENVQLTWNAQPQAISYIVKRNGTQIANPTTVSYTDVNAPSGLQSYCVIAKYSSCESEETCKSINVPIIICDPVNNLQLTLIGASVRISWNAHQQASSFIVKRNGSTIVNTNSTIYTDNNAPTGQNTYCVIAKYNSPACESEEECKSITVPVVVCDPINNLQINLINDYDVKLAWGAHQQASSFIVKRNNKIIATPSSASYTDTNVAPGEYNYCIIAVYATCESDAICDNIIIEEIPVPCEAPTGLVAEAIDNSVILEWDKMECADSYNIYCNDGLIATNIIEPTYTHDDPDRGIDLKYYVTAVNEAGESNSSNKVIINYVGIQNINGIKVKLYPNPTTGAITIECENMSQIIIYSLTGSVVHQADINSSIYEADFGHLTRGTYFIKIINSQGVKIEKLIKQ